MAGPVNNRIDLTEGGLVVTRSVEIPEAAVAKGAERLWLFRTPIAKTRESCTEQAREVLEAALPYLVPAEPVRTEAGVKAEALREAAEDERLVGLVPGTVTWLRERADELEGKR